MAAGAPGSAAPARTRAMPKSSTLSRPSRRTKRLSGLMSRWTMPWAWAATSTSSSSSARRRRSPRGTPPGRRARSASDCPSSSSITRKGAPSSVTSMSRTSTVPGCLKRLTAFASCSNRARSSGSRATSAWRILMASCRPILWVATYTAAIPPVPMRRSRVHLLQIVVPTRCAASVSRSIGRQVTLSVAGGRGQARFAGAEPAPSSVSDGGIHPAAGQGRLHRHPRLREGDHEAPAGRVPGPRADDGRHHDRAEVIARWRTLTPHGEVTRNPPKLFPRSTPDGYQDRDQRLRQDWALHRARAVRARGVRPRARRHQRSHRRQDAGAPAPVRLGAPRVQGREGGAHRQGRHRRRQGDRGARREGPGGAPVEGPRRRHRPRVHRALHRQGQGRGPPHGGRQARPHQRARPRGTT